MNSIVSALARIGQIQTRFDTYFNNQTQVTARAQESQTNFSATAPLGDVNTFDVNATGGVPALGRVSPSTEQATLLKAQLLNGVGRVVTGQNTNTSGAGLLRSARATLLGGTNTGTGLEGLGGLGGLGDTPTVSAFQQLLAERLNAVTTNSEKTRTQEQGDELVAASGTSDARAKSMIPLFTAGLPTSAVTGERVVETFANNRTMGSDFPYRAEITAAAQRYKLPVALVRSVIAAESNFNPFAVSEKGAMGLMQLMPETAARLGVRNPYDVAANLEGGTRYLRTLLDRYEGDYTKALSAYNAGEGALVRSLQDTGSSVPPYKETNLYIKKILNNYMKYSGVRP